MNFNSLTSCVTRRLPCHGGTRGKMRTRLVVASSLRSALSPLGEKSEGRTRTRALAFRLTFSRVAAPHGAAAIDLRPNRFSLSSAVESLESPLRGNAPNNTLKIGFDANHVGVTLTTETTCPHYLLICLYATKAYFGTVHSKVDKKTIRVRSCCSKLTEGKELTCGYSTGACPVYFAT
jgi:hypothetical protein